MVAITNDIAFKQNSTDKDVKRKAVINGTATAGMLTIGGITARELYMDKKIKNATKHTQITDLAIIKNKYSNTALIIGAIGLGIFTGVASYITNSAKNNKIFQNN